MAGNLAEVLGNKRGEYADLRPARYVRPEGLGLHRVALIPGETEVYAGSLIGRATLRPGAFVVVGTFSGRRQRMILGLAPPGYRGTSAFTPVKGVTQLEALRLLAAVPPVVLSGVNDQAVLLVGIGIRETDTFEAVERDMDTREWVPDPWVTLRDPVAVEEGALPIGLGQSVVQVTADVVSESPDAYRVAVRVRR